MRTLGGGGDEEQTVDWEGGGEREYHKMTSQLSLTIQVIEQIFGQVNTDRQVNK